MEWEAGKGFNGGTTRQAPDDTPQKFLRAIDIHTGKIVWELSQTGPGSTRGGTLSTASGLIFIGATPDNRLHAYDRAMLLSALLALLKQTSFTDVKLVAFNLDQQAELFRQERFDSP